MSTETSRTAPDVAAAETFVAATGRVLDRHRFAFHLRGATAGPVLRALEAYRTDDGGYGHGLESDLRTPLAQPGHVLTAIEHLDEVGARPDEDVLDWLDRAVAPDGSIPFVYNSAFDAPHAPWWSPQPDPPPSLHMAAALAAPLLRMRVEHPVADRLSAYCWDRLAHLDLGAGYEVRFVVGFLDAAPDRARADAALREIGEHVGPEGLRVRGGTEGEAQRPLDLAPWPRRPARLLFDQATIDAELGALAGRQHDDGGWDFDWLRWNEAVSCEWRGRVTVDALRILQANDRLG
ncbi:MAG: hypothetical protein HZB46_13400 [Solirubrobacterales bacterium]|nr:hypothetical protein [Solirubrobacterales bacterium]